MLLYTLLCAGSFLLISFVCCYLWLSIGDAWYYRKHPHAHMKGGKPFTLHSFPVYGAIALLMVLYPAIALYNKVKK